MSVTLDIADGVASIAIDRPEAKNAMDAPTAEGVRDAVERIERDPAVRVGILTGRGGVFCTGMDLKGFLRGDVVKWPGIGFAGLTQRRLAKPMIAAVEGYALAGGFELALACDLIVASREARFGLPEVKRGLVANAGGLIRLPRQVPARIANELVYTGDMVDAARLAAHGLINRVVEPGTALAEAQALAVRIAANGPLAIACSKRVMNEAPDWPADRAFERQFAITAPVFASADAKEGARAFAEKRAPVWKGK